MNKWLVGVGLVGVSLTIIGYFSPWFIQRIEINGEIISVISFTGNNLWSGLFGSAPVLASLITIFCILVSAASSIEKKFTSIVTKIIGIIVIMCGIVILIALFDKFFDFQTLASTLGTTISYKYGFILSAFGGILVLLAGIFGMFPIEPSTKTFTKG